MLPETDWLVAAALIAVPFVLFAVIEVVQANRHRRARAVAQRRKGPGRR